MNNMQNRSVGHTLQQLAWLWELDSSARTSSRRAMSLISVPACCSGPGTESHMCTWPTSSRGRPGSLSPPSSPVAPVKAQIQFFIVSTHAHLPLSVCQMPSLVVAGCWVWKRIPNKRIFTYSCLHGFHFPSLKVINWVFSRLDFQNIGFFFLFVEPWSIWLDFYACFSSTYTIRLDFQNWKEYS